MAHPERTVAIQTDDAHREPISPVDTMTRMDGNGRLHLLGEGEKHSEIKRFHKHAKRKKFTSSDGKILRLPFDRRIKVTYAQENPLECGRGLVVSVIGTLFDDVAPFLRVEQIQYEDELIQFDEHELLLFEVGIIPGVTIRNMETRKRIYSRPIEPQSLE